MTLDNVRRLLVEPAVATVRDLAQARGMPVLLVGGAVRDVLLGGASPHDLDFAVQGVQGDAVALGRAVANALSADFYVMDAKRGTARVIVKTQVDARPLLTMDFAVCRGTTWQEDLRARDFTINALGVNLDDGAVVDETGGLADLKARLIRATSDHALADDPVRALRAVRLAYQLDLRVDAQTLAQASAIDADVMQPSAERIRDEFFTMLELPDTTHALRQLDTMGLLTHIVPEIEPMRSCEQSAPHRFTVLEHTWRVMAAIDKLVEDKKFLNFQISIPNAIYRFAALMHDCAKPLTKTVGDDGRIHFYGHEALGADMAATRARALRLSGAEVSRVRTIVRNHMRANQMAREPHLPTPRALYRFFREAGDCAPELALFAIADCLGKRGDQTQPEDCEGSAKIAKLLLDRYYDQFEKSAAPPPLITGKDIIDLGIKQGPKIGQILEAVREAQMTGEISTREEGLAIAKFLSLAS